MRAPMSPIFPAAPCVTATTGSLPAASTGARLLTSRTSSSSSAAPIRWSTPRHVTRACPPSWWTSRAASCQQASRAASSPRSATTAGPLGNWPSTAAACRIRRWSARKARRSISLPPDWKPRVPIPPHVRSAWHRARSKTRCSTRRTAHSSATRSAISRPSASRSPIWPRRSRRRAPSSTPCARRSTKACAPTPKRRWSSCSRARCASA
ncbi:hypothetical protein D9M68_760420 [compost metagenome]